MQCNIENFKNIAGNQTLKSEGEDCGSCFCPPTYTAGKCGPGLECIHNERIPDLAGKCVSIGMKINVSNGIKVTHRFVTYN